MSGTGGTGNRGVTSLAVSSEVVQNSLERAERLLAAINGGVYRAMGADAGPDRGVERRPEAGCRSEMRGRGTAGLAG